MNFNLVLMHRYGKPILSDFITIRNMMSGRAPDIEVFVVPIEAPSAERVPLVIWQRPTLIFSPVPVEFPRQPRGRLLSGRNLSKSEELEHLLEAGLPVPESLVLGPETRIDEDIWGPFSVLKPDRGELGQGVRLVRTRDVRWVDPSSWPKGDPRYGKQIIAQRFIDTGLHATSYRVMTVLGEAVSAVVSIALNPRPLLDPSDASPLSIDIASNSGPRTMSLTYDDDVIELAKSVARSFPDIPVLGVDIIREKETQKLYVTEINPQGGTWHLSSRHGQAQQREHRLDEYGQFGALDIIANALIKATRTLAQ